MIRVSITSAAFDAIRATLPVGSAAYGPQRTAQGGYFIWVERSWLNKLEALRQPGEGLSETIIRLVAMEAGGRPGRRRALRGEQADQCNRQTPFVGGAQSAKIRKRRAHSPSVPLRQEFVQPATRWWP